ncbi:MAG: AMP-binding protein, partial [Alphaproteobacteria bacterium]|nr:AMP-binding protein [Alphaproteobacteria bacterium]
MPPRAITTANQKGADWDTHLRGFRWRVPKRFNIAEVCCDAWARAEPARVAIRHVGQDGSVTGWSYGALRSASNRLANALAARGVRRGDRVALVLPQGPEVMIAHFAAYKLGAIVLPMVTLFGPDALAYRLGDSGASALVCDPVSLGRVQGLAADLPALREIYVTGTGTGPGPDGVRGFWAEIDAAQENITAAPTGPDDPACLIYTSGTTGPPKGALHAHRYLLGHLPSVELHHELLPQPGDVGWTPADWAWIGGLM